MKLSSFSLQLVILKLGLILWLNLSLIPVVNAAPVITIGYETINNTHAIYFVCSQNDTKHFFSLKNSLFFSKICRCYQHIRFLDRFKFFTTIFSIKRAFISVCCNILLLYVQPFKKHSVLICSGS